MIHIVNAPSLHPSLQELSKKRIMFLGTDRVEESLMDNIGVIRQAVSFQGSLRRVRSYLRAW